ncbi:MAG: hypothetical protein FWG85_03050 [Bacteroidetes bacterium]|nr:hypothetical protein [Bacteroidota bacterium]
MKKIILFFIFVVILLLSLGGCGLFETRNPTPPDDNNVLFVPPTSEDIVIDNFLMAFNSKNIDNYCQCFSDSFSFIPSAEANLNYAGLFDNWKIQNERMYFLSLVNAIGNSNMLDLQLNNIKYETQTSDSVVLFADYIINLGLADATDTKYTGILSWTITLTNNGLWYISRWMDFHSESGTDKTFSDLKARFNS